MTDITLILCTFLTHSQLRTFYVDAEKKRTVTVFLFCFIIYLKCVDEVFPLAGQSGRKHSGGAIFYMSFCNVQICFYCSIHEITATSAVDMYIDKSRSYVSSFCIDNGSVGSIDFCF